MRLVTCATGAGTCAAVRSTEGLRATPYASVLELLRSGEEGWAAAREARASGDLLNGARILAPIPRPAKLIFGGANYREHIVEVGLKFPTEPVIFAKLPSSVIGPGDAIVKAQPDTQLDYEGELAVVIGRTARKLTEADALSCVAGYTVINDVSDRGLHFDHGQLTLGKGFDTACPMGPDLVTVDEVPDPQDLTLTTRVNGDVRQSASTGDMIFTVVDHLVHITRHVTLEPGDIVATGTPGGIGYGRKPPIFLMPGDLVTVEIGGVGTLTNTVVAAP